MPFCTRCGATIDAEDRFCRECGTEVRARASVSSPRAATEFRPMPVVPSRQDVALEPVPRHDNDDASGDVLLGPIAAPTSLRFDAASDTSSGRRLVFVIGCFVIVAISGLAVYRWFNRSVPERQPAAVETTEQSIEVPAATTGTAARPDTPHGGEASNVIADFTKDTTDAANALGAPDGRTAVIAPGGSLALAWAGPFYNDHGADVRVHGPVGHRVSYIIFARSGPEEPWVRFDINRKGLGDGTASHDFGHHGIARAEQIMIRNEGSSALYLDAVTPLHRQPETHSDDESADHGPAK